MASPQNGELDENGQCDFATCHIGSIVLCEQCGMDGLHPDDRNNRSLRQDVRTTAAEF